jgi:DNA-binding transcriptional LysR family regulator
VGAAVHDEAARHADPLPAVTVEGHRRLAAAHQPLVETIECFQQRRVGEEIVAPPSQPIARRARCSLAALDGQPFIGFDWNIPTRRMVDRLLRRHGVRISYVMELDNIETIKRSVEAGLGLSLLPALTLASEVRARTLVARPPVEGPFGRPIGALYRRTRERSGAAQAFLAVGRIRAA